jgi:hypothetical protein
MQVVLCQDYYFINQSMEFLFFTNIDYYYCKSTKKFIVYSYHFFWFSFLNTLNIHKEIQYRCLVCTDRTKFLKKKFLKKQVDFKKVSKMRSFPYKNFPDFLIVIKHDTVPVCIHHKTLHFDRHKWREKHQLTKYNTSK